MGRDVNTIWIDNWFLRCQAVSRYNSLPVSVIGLQQPLNRMLYAAPANRSCLLLLFD